MHAGVLLFLLRNLLKICRYRNMIEEKWHEGENTNEKTQFFIKPEKGQVSFDHKDLDPSKILAKIEVQFRGRKITQEFEDNEE